MDATFHPIIAQQHIQDRIAEATSERAARAVKPPRRWFFFKPAPDRSRPAASPPRASATPS
jgi:hypothetical protein